jgi:hypothetical protein
LSIVFETFLEQCKIPPWAGLQWHQATRAAAGAGAGTRPYLIVARLSIAWNSRSGSTLAPRIPILASAPTG